MKQQLDPPRQIGETATCQDDPFALRDVQFEIAEDLLPPPEQLVFKGPATEKITIALTKDSLDFFRQKWTELDAPYQRMIRNLIDAYVAHSSS